MGVYIQFWIYSTFYATGSKASMMSLILTNSVKSAVTPPTTSVRTFSVRLKA